MKKIALSAYIIFSLVFTSVLFLPATPVLACADREPETLLSLYVESEFVYRARYVGEEAGEPKNDGEGSITTEIKRTFEPVATFKGKTSEKVELFHTKYEYVPTEPDVSAVSENPVEAPPQTEPAVEEKPSEHEETTPEEEPEFEEEGEIELVPGDIVLLFLRHDKETSRLELTEFVDGLKKLESQDRDVYEARIKELGPIMAKKKPDVEAIIDWLIRCAEEKATRWEGTWELERSFNNLEYEKARAEEEKSADEPEETPIERKRFGLGGTAEFATELSEYHRQTLTNLFIRSRAERQPGSEEVRGDFELMRLVTKWPDQRIAPALIERLREGGEAYWEMSQAMSAVATILRDKRLDDLSKRFEETMYLAEDEIAEVQPKSRSKKPLTNGEVRAASLAKFIDRASRLSRQDAADKAQKRTAAKTTAVLVEN